MPASSSPHGRSTSTASGSRGRGRSGRWQSLVTGITARGDRSHSTLPPEFGIVTPASSEKDTASPEHSHSENTLRHWPPVSARGPPLHFIAKSNSPNVKKEAWTAKVVMACKSCGSDNQSKFGAEINIHFPGRAGLDMPPVLVFPKLLVCLDCGFTEFTVPETEFHRLARDAAASIAL